MLRGSSSVSKLLSRSARESSRVGLANAAPLNHYNRSNIASRFYSSQKDAKKNDKPQSILTDDILSKAGFDEPLEKEKQQQESSSSRSEQTQGEQEGPEEPEETGGKRRRKRRAQTTKDIQREKYANWFYVSTFVGGILGVGYMSREWDSAEEQKKLEATSIPNGYNPSDVWARLNKRLGSLFTFFSEPAFENLLPPPPPEAYRRPMTLVLTLDDLLIHSEWDTKHGWRTGKRPGLDYFLGYLSQYYEIVVFGSNYQMYSERAVTKLDPLHAYISYALYREGCRYKDGKLIKDLSLLNRDLGKVIMVDVEEEPTSAQPENSIVLKPWDGKPDDTLIKLIPVLEYIATQPIKDVRPILNTYADKSAIVDEFAEREKKLRARWYEENKHLLNGGGNFVGNLLSKLMGVESISTGAGGPSGPKMPLDIIREHGQMQYEHFQNYLKENAPKFLAEEQKMKDEFGKVTLNNLITQGPPSQEDIMKAQLESMKKQQEESK